MLPAGLAFNLDTVPGKMLDMARAIDPHAHKPTDFLDQVSTLRTAVGIPATLTALNVPRGELNRLVEVALADGCHPFNPRPVTANDFESIFTEAF